jgi:cobalt transporter subunit CbtA
VIRHTLLAGIIAGLFAGAVGFTAQALKVTPLIHKAEIFEATAKARARLSGKPTGSVVLAATSPRHPLVGAGLTLAASLLTGAGFGLLLAGAIAFSGRDPTVTEGLLWGFAGFGVFTLAPALVLPPHLPGMAESDLATRQLWWLGIAGATGAGASLIAFAGRWRWRALGLALLSLPFIAGGPVAGSGEGATLPAALVAAFVAATITASAAFWAGLGVAVSVIFSRFSALEAS